MKRINVLFFMTCKRLIQTPLLFRFYSTVINFKGCGLSIKWLITYLLHQMKKDYLTQNLYLIVQINNPYFIFLSLLLIQTIVLQHLRLSLIEQFLLILPAFLISFYFKKITDFKAKLSKNKSVVNTSYII